MVLPFTSLFFIALSLFTFKLNADATNVAVKKAADSSPWTEKAKLIYLKADKKVSDNAFKLLTNFFVDKATAEDNLSKCKAASAYYVLLDYLATKVEQAFEKDKDVQLHDHLKNEKVLENLKDYVLQYTSCHRTPSYDTMLNFLLQKEHLDVLTTHPQALILHAKFYPNYLTAYFKQHQCSCLFQPKKLTCFPKVTPPEAPPAPVTSGTSAEPSNNKVQTPHQSPPVSTSDTITNPPPALPASGGGYATPNNKNNNNNHRNTNNKNNNNNINTNANQVNQEDDDDDSCWSPEPEGPSSGAYANPPEAGAYANPPGMGVYANPLKTNGHPNAPEMGAYANPPGLGAYANPSMGLTPPTTNANANANANAAEAPSSSLETTSLDTDSIEEESRAMKTLVSSGIVSFVICFLFSL